MNISKETNSSNFCSSFTFFFYVLLFLLLLSTFILFFLFLFVFPFLFFFFFFPPFIFLCLISHCWNFCSLPLGFFWCESLTRFWLHLFCNHSYIGKKQLDPFLLSRLYKLSSPNLFLYIMFTPTHHPGGHPLDPLQFVIFFPVGSTEQIWMTYMQFTGLSSTPSAKLLPIQATPTSIAVIQDKKTLVDTAWVVQLEQKTKPQSFSLLTATI